MQAAPDLGIPDVKPAIESIRGRWEPKMSSRRQHSLLQVRFAALLTAWAGERGEVGTEWRFYFLPKGERPSSLVPDVAYVSFERMPLEYGELRERPTIAPDVAVEILSPDDRRALLDEKIAMYIGFGSLLVIVADPETQTIEMHEPAGVRWFAQPLPATCAAYTDLTIDTATLFEKI
ncbi:MAG TPA: Uma2 family endonuclease [Candidatus Baltobacteraceae bacterium]|nr:Uma2 family endonuclease [Candidatus Baltobacteraceae bacterium]